MNATKPHERPAPIRWSVQQTVIVEEHRFDPLPSLERRKAARRRQTLTRLGPDDTVVQRHPTTPRNVSIERAHAVPDDNWEV